jgi:hypothetical protein
MRGGGVFELSPFLLTILSKAAWIDFVHDFNDATRARISTGMLNNDPFGPVIGTNKIAGIQRLLDGGGGTTAFHVFRNLLSNLQFGTVRPFEQFLAGAGATGILHETDILDVVGVPYTEVISSLPNTIAPPIAPAIAPALPVTRVARPIGPIDPSAPPPPTYAITSYPTKVNGRYLHTAESFFMVTGQAYQIFVLMFDAAGCKLNIGDKWLSLGKPGKPGDVSIEYFNVHTNPAFVYHFVILNSKENISDPATKPTSRNVTEALGVEPGQANICIYFLEEAEPGHTSVYPLVQAGKQDANGAAFSAFTISTRRTGNENAPKVQATATTGAGVFNIDDVGADSEVTAATQRAVTMALNRRPNEEILLSFIMKRFGDWCQALCLLDKTRKYKVVQVNTGGGAPILGEGDVTTLEALETMNAIVFLLTLDRVLLAFALLLGLNVVFTSKSGSGGVGWLTFFKNTANANVDDAQELYNGLESIRSTLQLQRDGLAGELEAYETYRGLVTASVGNFPGYPNIFVKLRSMLSMLSFLPKISVIERYITELPLKTALDAAIQNARNPDGSFNKTPELVGLLGTVRSSRDAAKSIGVAISDYTAKKTSLDQLFGAADKREWREKTGFAREWNAIVSFTFALKKGVMVLPTNQSFVTFRELLQEIKEDATVVGVDVPTIEGVDAAYTAYASAVDPRIPDQVELRAGRNVGAAGTPKKPLSLLFEIFDANLVRGGSKQRGGARLEDLFESPLTDMVYVNPATSQQFVPLDFVIPRQYETDSPKLRELYAIATSEATTLLGGQPGSTPDMITPLADELFATIYRQGVYGGVVSDGHGRIGSVIDPYLFFHDDDLHTYLLDTPAPRPLPGQSLDPLAHFVYVGLRYMLYMTDTLYQDIARLESVDIENAYEFTEYNRIASVCSTLSTIFVPGTALVTDSVTYVAFAEALRGLVVNPIIPDEKDIDTQLDTLVASILGAPVLVAQKLAEFNQENGENIERSQKMNEENFFAYLRRRQFIGSFLNRLKQMLNGVRNTLFQCHYASGLYQLAYPPQPVAAPAPPAGGIRRKTHRRRSLPKLI